ncbi:MAG: glycosyltransferase family 2 protein [Pseudomonadales bacterium]|nr:glycosyltransferase family 2 protein [Pseudomonadales bacterium]
MSRKKKLSVITVAYNMPRQALNTAYSLSINHQKNVDESDYEIILMENSSNNNIDPDELKKIGGNIKHMLRNEPSQSPTPAINEAFAIAESDYICFIIDAARMVTPRVIEYALMARAVSPASVFSVPSYNLGPCEHQDQELHGYDESVEQKLLDHINWKSNGYRLFDICNISEANQKGIFHPLLESNFLASSFHNFASIGFACPDFMLPGGGGINLHMFRSIATKKTTHYLFTAPGEGSFHQIHGGITTKQDPERVNTINHFRTQLESYWNGNFQPVSREPVLLGAVGSHAQKFLYSYSKLGEKRWQWRNQHNLPIWQDEEILHPHKTH